MSEIWIAVLVTIILIIIVLTTKNRMDARKRDKKIKESFGKIPAGSLGKNTAHTFWQAYTESGRLPRQHVDELTWDDLDMDEVFFRLNACQSTVGDVWQYAALHFPQKEEELRLRAERIEHIAAKPDLRLKLQIIFAKLGRRNMAGLDISAFDAEQMTFQYRTLFRLLAFAPFLGLFLFFVSYKLAAGWLLISLVANIVLSIWAKTKNAANFYSIRYLSAMLGTAQKLAVLLKDDLPGDALQLKERQKSFFTFRKSLILLNINQTFENLGLVDPLSFFLLPILSYAKIASNLAENQAYTLQLIRDLGELDMAVSIVSFRQSLPYTHTQPHFLEQPGLEMEKIYHPLLEEPIANSVYFKKGSLITGSNASGKSTFIKAVAINCILAQTIYTCTAQRFCLHPGLVVTSMAVQDNIIDGDSYFVAEIKSMKRLVQKAQHEYCYLFVDEILKGTNTIERVAASAAVLQYIAQLNAVCTAATHDIELTYMLEKVYQNFHFGERIEDGSVRFDYLLREGPATGRNAIRLLSELGFPETITGEAENLVDEFEKTGLWRCV